MPKIGWHTREMTRDGSWTQLQVQAQLFAQAERMWRNAVWRLCIMGCDGVLTVQAGSRSRKLSANLGHPIAAADVNGDSIETGFDLTQPAGKMGSHMLLCRIMKYPSIQSAVKFPGFNSGLSN